MLFKSDCHDDFLVAQAQWAERLISSLWCPFGYSRAWLFICGHARHNAVKHPCLFIFLDNIIGVTSHLISPVTNITDVKILQLRSCLFGRSMSFNNPHYKIWLEVTSFSNVAILQGKHAHNTRFYFVRKCTCSDQFFDVQYKALHLPVWPKNVDGLANVTSYKCYLPIQCGPPYSIRTFFTEIDGLRLDKSLINQ